MDEPAVELLLYQTKDRKLQMEVVLLEDSIWLTQKQMARLFQTTKQNVSLHIHAIFKGWETQAAKLWRILPETAADGRHYETLYYNLDVIISVCDRMRSQPGAHFRAWAARQVRKATREKQS